MVRVWYDFNYNKMIRESWKQQEITRFSLFCTPLHSKTLQFSNSEVNRSVMNEGDVKEQTKQLAISKHWSDRVNTTGYFLNLEHVSWAVLFLYLKVITSLLVELSTVNEAVQLRMQSSWNKPQQASRLSCLVYSCMFLSLLPSSSMTERYSNSLKKVILGSTDC